jgi:hypothetical protein
MTEQRTEADLREQSLSDTVVYGAVAAVLGLRGPDRLQQATPPVPEQTVETVKEDVEWAKTRTRSAQR